MKQYNIATFFAISCFCLVCFLPFLGSVHLFDWDEINFAENAREMLVTNNWGSITINFEPFWEKPPLFIWMQAISMKIFGINEFAARFPTVLSSLLTLNLIYFIGVKHFRPSLAAVWVLVYLGSLIPHFYIRTGLIDPTFNLFIFLAIYQLALAYSHFQKVENNNANVIWGAVFVGLAILTKGPVALLIFLLVFFILCFFTRKIFIKPFAFVLAVFIILGIVSAWFMPETLKNGTWFIQRFLQYQFELLTQNVAGHQQPFYYHFIVLFFGCFPAAFFAIKAFFLRIENHREKPFFITFQILFWVVLILFSIVKTKIIHYSSLCWLPLTFLAAYYIDKLLAENIKIKNWQKLFLLLSGFPIILFLSLVPYINNLGKHTFLLSKIKDVFALTVLQVNSNFSMLSSIVASLLAIALMGVLFLAFWNKKYIIHLFITNFFVCYFSALLFVPVIDAKLQKDLFQFYKSQVGKDVYIETIGFKSYAHYFYAKMQPLKLTDGLHIFQNKALFGKKLQDLNAKEYDLLQSKKQRFLLDSAVDKPVYLIYKIGNDNLPMAKNGFFSLGKKGGYLVYKRNKSI